MIFSPAIFANVPRKIRMKSSGTLGSFRISGLRGGLFDIEKKMKIVIFSNFLYKLIMKLTSQ